MKPKHKIKKREVNSGGNKERKKKPDTNTPRMWVPILLFLLPLLFYSNTINHKYAFDDSIVITENEFTKKGIDGIPMLLTKDMFEGMYGQQLEVTGGRYRPLSLLMFAVEYEIFGRNPKPGHLINILLYSLLVVVCFYSINLLSGNPVLAFVTAILFAAHPIHTEVVANIKSRDEILGLLFGVSSLYLMLQYIQRKSIALLAFSLLCFYLALLSKETSVVFLALIPAAIHVKWSKPLSFSVLKSFVPLFAIFIIYFLIRANLVGLPGGADSSDIMENPFVESGFSEKFATISIILGKYLKLLVFPHPLSSDYSFNQIPVRGWGLESVMWGLLYCSMLVYASIYIFKRSLYAFAVLLFLLPFLITGNIFFNIGAPMGERFAFIPSLGYTLVISLLLFKLLGKDQSPINFRSLNRILILLVPLLLLGSWKTIDRNRDWKNNLVLFSTDVKTVDKSAKIHYYYGNTLLNRYLSGDKKDIQKLRIAKSEFLKSVNINPEFHWAHFNLGKSYDYLGMTDSAIYHLEKVLEINPTHISTQGVLGIIYGREKEDYQRAVYYLRKAIEYGDKTKANYHNLAIANALSGKPDEAVLNFKEAIKLDPDNARLYYELAITYQGMNKIEAAQPYFEKAYQLEPSLRK